MPMGHCPCTALRNQRHQPGAGEDGAVDGVSVSSSFQASVSPLQVCCCSKPNGWRELWVPRLAFRLGEGRAAAPGIALPLGRGIQSPLQQRLTQALGMQCWGRPCPRLKPSSVGLRAVPGTCSESHPVPSGSSARSAKASPFQKQPFLAALSQALAPSPGLPPPTCASRCHAASSLPSPWHLQLLHPTPPPVPVPVGPSGSVCPGLSSGLRPSLGILPRLLGYGADLPGAPNVLPGVGRGLARKDVTHPLNILFPGRQPRGEGCQQMSGGSTRWSPLGEGTDARGWGLHLWVGVFAAPCPKKGGTDPNQLTPIDTPLDVAVLSRVPQAARSAGTDPCVLLGAHGGEHRRPHRAPCCRRRRRRFGTARVRCCCAQH